MSKREAEKKQWLIERKVNVPLLVAGLVFFVIACWWMTRYRFFYHPVTGKLARKKMVASLAFWALPTMLALVKVKIPQRYNTLCRWSLMAVGILGGVVAFNLTSWQIALPTIQKFISINLAVSAALFMLLWVFVWDVRIVAPLGCALWTLAGYAYRCVYIFRGTPFTPTDLVSIGTALAVAGDYSYKMILEDFISIAIVLNLIGIARWIPAEKPRGCRLRVAKGACIALEFGIIALLLFTTILNDMGTMSEAWAYQRTNTKQGAMTTCLYECRILFAQKPAEYNLERLSALADEVRFCSDAASVGNRKPTVIAIMNEALSDPQLYMDIETEQDVMPFLHSLRAQSLHGVLYVPVLGGSTCNSEQGFLTGMMPIPSIRYQLFETASTPTPSIAWLLKSQGYSTIAIHPERGGNYQRDTKYPLLGLDKFLTIEDFEGAEWYRNRISDRACYQKIIELYEQRAENEPLFIFNVTMQNHGGYKTGLGRHDIELADPDNVISSWVVEEYVNCIRESDQAFSELIAYFRQQEEPVVVLIFGDHQPNLFGITDMPHEGEQVENVLYDYRTPFYIWANYPIETGDYGNLSVNYLSALLLKTAGIPMEPYNAWCLNIAQEYPVVTVQGYADADGRFYDWNAGEWPQALKDMNILRYNRLYDVENRLQGLDVGVPD